MEKVFAEHGLGLPDIAAQTRSNVVLKSLIMQSGFLS